MDGGDLAAFVGPGNEFRGESRADGECKRLLEVFEIGAHKGRRHGVIFRVRTVRIEADRSLGVEPVRIGLFQGDAPEDAKEILKIGSGAGGLVEFEVYHWMRTPAQERGHSTPREAEIYARNNHFASHILKASRGAAKGVACPAARGRDRLLAANGRAHADGIFPASRRPCRQPGADPGEIMPAFELPRRAEIVRARVAEIGLGPMLPPEDHALTLPRGSMPPTISTSCRA